MSKGSKKELEYTADRDEKDVLDDDELDRIRTEHITTIGKIDFYSVDDEYVRNYVDIDFVFGGNYAHDAYVPKNEIWISELLKASDVGPGMVHEYVESYCMAEEGMAYDDAHDQANKFEKLYRQYLIDNALDNDTYYWSTMLDEATNIIHKFNISNSIKEALTQVAAEIEKLDESEDY